MGLLGIVLPSDEVGGRWFETRFNERAVLSGGDGHPSGEPILFSR